jgi:putative peptidoglycan lipid II flippase
MTNAPQEQPGAQGSQELDSLNTARNATIISICTIISRITGFARTWAMAFALGATFLSSSYQVANNLPNQLYELVMGGMLATAFLPVYMSTKKQIGKKADTTYASNLLSIVVVGLGVLALICILFPAQIVYTQTFFSNQEEMQTSVFFFQIFAIQIVFYGASAIISGLLNANRDYIWGAIAPVFNNIIVIATFLIYAALAPTNQTLALWVVAIGNPLGVFVQLAVQLPGLKRNGIRLKFHINLKDPHIRETAALGLPALFITVLGFITVSVANAASYTFAENGPSVIAYSRLWFTFPYSFLAVPVATTMFTELSAMQAARNDKGVAKGILAGTSQIMFLMIPCAMYLIVFAEPLVTLYHVGAFTQDAIAQIQQYLAVMAIALPFYGVNTFIQMIFSSIRKMKACSVFMFAGSAAQVAAILAGVAAQNAGLPASINIIALATFISYFVSDGLAFAYLSKKYSKLGFSIKQLLKSCGKATICGLAGAIVGGAIFWALSAFVASPTGSIGLSLAYVIVAGLISIAVTFAPAIKFNFPEAAFVISIANKITRKLHRH